MPINWSCKTSKYVIHVNIFILHKCTPLKQHNTHLNIQGANLCWISRLSAPTTGKGSPLLLLFCHAFLPQNGTYSSIQYSTIIESEYKWINNASWAGPCMRLTEVVTLGSRFAGGAHLCPPTVLLCSSLNHRGKRGQKWRGRLVGSASPWSAKECNQVREGQHLAQRIRHQEGLGWPKREGVVLNFSGREFHAWH